MLSIVPPRMGTIKEAAKTFNIAEYRIRQWCINGEIVAKKAGNHWLVNFDRLIDYLNTPEPQAPPTPQIRGIQRIQE